MQIKEIIQNSNLAIPQEQIRYAEPMNKHTSFKTGGPAEVFITVKNENELQEILNIAKQNDIKTYIIGNGSNLLVTDEGIKGIVVKIDIQKLEIEKTKAIVGAGNKIAQVAYKFLENDLSGFEELSGIPGTIGGAIKMNAGAHGKEIKDLVEAVKILDENGNIQTLESKEMEFKYRNSIISRKEWIVLETILKLKEGKQEEIKQKMQEYAKTRKEKQPLEYPSAGSTFKRGENYITAKLIDEAGLKGYQIGGAQISEKHAGFIINKENATSEDIIKLIRYTQEKVKEKFNIEIEQEVEIIGE